MELFEVESMVMELNAIASNIKVSAEMLAKHGYKGDSKNIEMNAQKIEEIRDLIKEHLELKVFLKNLLK